MAKQYVKQIRLLARELRKNKHPRPRAEAKLRVLGEKVDLKLAARIDARLAKSASKKAARARRKSAQAAGTPWKAYSACKDAKKMPATPAI